MPGYTINPDGSIIVDELIVSALEQYRNKKEFSNGGGYQKLTWYLRRDFNYIVNSKKVYRLCQENDLLLPKKKKLKLFDLHNKKYALIRMNLILLLFSGIEQLLIFSYSEHQLEDYLTFEHISGSFLYLYALTTV